MNLLSLVMLSRLDHSRNSSLIEFSNLNLFNFYALDTSKHCSENFPDSAYELLLKYDRPYFDICHLEIGFLVMYLSEELLGSHISDLFKCLVISHLSATLQEILDLFCLHVNSSNSHASVWQSFSALKWLQFPMQHTGSGDTNLLLVVGGKEVVQGLECSLNVDIFTEVQSITEEGKLISRWFSEFTFPSSFVSFL